MVRSNKDEKDEFSPDVIRVLHIDDEEDFLFLTKEFVEKMSEGEIQVESLRNPKEVFERIKDNNIDIIICDYLMEDLNGLDLLKQIKQREFQIPFIIFTGRGREEVVIDALNLGADYYIRKGLDAKSQYTELVHQIRTVLRHKKAEQALTESEKTIRRERDLTQHYLNEANVMFVIVNENEIVELMNKEVTYVLGYTEKDLIGRNWFTTVYSSEYVDELRFSFQQVIVGMQKPTPYFEIEMETKNGDKRIIAWRNTTIKDENDKVIKILGVGDDITQRKEIEEALQQSEEKYRKLVDTSPDSIVLADLEGNITLANQQAAFMHGVDKPEELIGCSMIEFTAPEDHERIMERMRKQMFSSLKGSFEYTMLKKNGESFPIELSAAIITDKSNKPIALMAIGRDLSQRKIAEEALKESEEKYRGFVQNFDGIAFQGSINFKPFFFHGAVEQITGYTEEDFVSGELTWDQLVLEKDMKLLLAINEDLENIPGYSNEMEYRIRNKNGDIRWIRQHLQNITLKEGDPFIVQGSLYDITEKKLIEEKQKESEKLYKITFESTGTANLIAKSDKTINLVNSRFEELTGLKKNEIENKMKWSDFLSDEETTRFEKLQELHYQDPTLAQDHFETSLILKDGTNINVYLTIKTIPESTDFIVTLIDISQMKLAEEQLKESEALYRTLFEATGTANAIARADSIVEKMNDRLVEMSGYSKEEVEGKLSWQTFVDESELERLMEYNRKRMIDPTSVPASYEAKLNDKNGNIVPCLIHVGVIPNTEKFIISLTDISENKEAKNELLKSAELYKTIFEATGAANMIVGPNRIIKQVNSKIEEVSGYMRD
ncbi:MAG: PAS domain S-box protein [Candidatus Heimdallarchaeaceae archaeon]